MISASASGGDEAPGLALRPVADDDREFLNRLYACSSGIEFTGMPEIVEWQSQLQDRHYRERYPDARFDIVTLNGEPIGRFYVAQTPDAFIVLDIAFLPASRSQGFGSIVMRKLLFEADQQKRPVRIHVRNGSPANRFYHRLGFHVTGDDSLFISMTYGSVHESTCVQGSPS